MKKKKPGSTQKINSTGNGQKNESNKCMSSDFNCFINAGIVIGKMIEIHSVCIHS